MSREAELALRLILEEVVTCSPDDFADVGRQLSRIARDGRALRATGGVSAALVAEIVAEAELALFLRGADWLEIVLSDLPSPWRMQASAIASRLVSVCASGDALVEVWDDALAVRTAGEAPWRMPGGVPDGHERLEVKTSSGSRIFDLSEATPGRPTTETSWPITPVELVIVWAIVSGALPSAPSAGGGRPDDRLFEPIAIDTGRLVLTAIEGGEIIHGHVPDPPAVAWISSAAGVHVVSDGLVIDPPVPPPPGPLTLVTVDGGVATAIPLRQPGTPR